MIVFPYSDDRSNDNSAVEYVEQLSLKSRKCV